MRESNSEPWWPNANEAEDKKIKLGEVDKVLRSLLAIRPETMHATRMGELIRAVSMFHQCKLPCSGGRVNE